MAGAASPLHVSELLTCAGGCSGALSSIMLGLGTLKGQRLQWKSLRCGRGQVTSLCLQVSSSETPLSLVDLDLDLAEGCMEDPWRVVPGKVGERRLCSVGICLALPGPGKEGDQPPGGEGAEGAEQENPRGQSAGAAEGGVALSRLRGVRRPSLVRAWLVSRET